MMHKLLLRQLQRKLKVNSEQELAELWQGLAQRAPAEREAALLLARQGIVEFIAAVDDTYRVNDRNQSLSARSLELSSAELFHANQQLRDLASSRQHVIDRLRDTANRVLRTLGREPIPAGADDLERLALMLTDLVVEREQTRKELNRALEDFRNEQFALDQHAIVSTTDTDGNIQYVNDKFCVLSGYSRQEVLGANHRLLNSGYHPKTYHRKLWRTVASGEVWRGEVKNRAKSGDFYWLDMTVVPFVGEDGKPYQYTAICTDITTRKRDEEELRLAAAVFENSMEGILIADAQGKLNRVNNAFVEQSGYTRKELVGALLTMLIADQPESDFYARMWEALGQGGYWQGEMWGRRKTGETYPGWLSIVAVQNHDQEVSHHIASCWDMSDYKAQDEEIERLAYSDKLTGLPNRAALSLRFEVALTAAKRYGGCLGLLLFDLDRFKEINDVHGHDIGDRVLIAVAKRMQAVLGDEDMLIREGGDEFILLIEGMNCAEDAVQIAQRMQQVMAEPLRVDDNEFVVGMSMGIALSPGDGETLDVLLKNADIAMYQAKLSDEGYCFYQADMGRALVERLEIALALRRAIETDALALHFQPFFKLGSREVIGAEALLRWHDPERGWVAPSVFIPIAEERGFIGALGEWVLRSVARQLNGWRAQGYRLNGRIAVNISMLQFQRQDFVANIRRVLEQESGISEEIEVELTESSVMDYVRQALEQMKELREHGFAISIDDFGTGYSSLAYLRQLPVSKLKIDQSFVHNMVQDQNGWSIVQAIISLGRALGLRVIAEGIESEEQLHILMEMGCLEGQGHYFSKAVPADEFARNFLLKAGLH